MGLRAESVRVHGDVLVIEGEIYHGEGGMWVKRCVRVPAGDVTLTEPIRGPKGGFKYAELLLRGQLKWMFVNDHARLYDRVVRAIQTWRRHAGTPK